MDPLRTSLLDLHFELRDLEIPLTVGGGFGLFLKRLDLEALRLREHRLFRDDFRLEDFSTVLGEIFSR